MRCAPARPRRVSTILALVLVLIRQRSFCTDLAPKGKRSRQNNMSDEGEEQKPNVGGGPEHLNLQVKSQDGNVVHFKAKITTPFRKLMTAYCDRQSVASESVVFLFEGERLRGEQTPQEVGMEDGDSIDVVIHQVGGRQA